MFECEPAVAESFSSAEGFHEVGPSAGRQEQIADRESALVLPAGREEVSAFDRLY